MFSDMTLWRYSKKSSVANFVGQRIWFLQQISWRIEERDKERKEKKDGEWERERGRGEFDNGITIFLKS